MPSRLSSRKPAVAAILTPRYGGAPPGTEGLRGAPQATQRRWLGPKSPDVFHYTTRLTAPPSELGLPQAFLNFILFFEVMMCWRAKFLLKEAQGDWPDRREEGREGGIVKSSNWRVLQAPTGRPPRRGLGNS